MLNKATKMDRQLIFFKVAKFRQICFNSWKVAKRKDWDLPIMKTFIVVTGTS